MLDTLGMGLAVPGIEVGALRRLGWDVYTRESEKGSDVWAVTEAGGVRLCYGAGFAWLRAEASLPALIGKSNAELLDCAQCREALCLVRDVAEAAVKRGLPPLSEWRVSRFDPVWAWDSEPSLYLAALVAGRLPRTEPVRYGTSVLYKTRSGRTRARAYDKAHEQGHSVELPLRVERQVRRREVVRCEGLVVGRSVDDALSERVCFSILRDALSALGLDKPIPSIGQTRALLVNGLGKRAGRNSWALLRDVVDGGGVWPSDVSKWSKRKAEGQWREAGVSAVSLVGELPPLALPAVA